MKKTMYHGTFKWTAIFLILIVLSVLLFSLYLNQKNPSQIDIEEPEQTPLEVNKGTLSNETFAALIEENLSELGFAESIHFEGEDFGYFDINGTLSAPERLTAVAPELKSLEIFFDAMKGEVFTIHGHLGKNDDGNGCFVTDTITFSNYTVPAGIATEYIEKYTGLNKLLKVPFEQIKIMNDGVTFEGALPEIIQTALYK